MESSGPCKEGTAPEAGTGIRPLVGMGAWLSAFIALSGRTHMIYGYEVFESGLHTQALLAVGVPGAFLLWMQWRRHPEKGKNAFPWAMGSLAIPGLAGLRVLGLGLPFTFGEPIFLAYVTWRMAWLLSSEKISKTKDRTWSFIAVLAVVLCASWWFYQSHRAYSDYLLGYADFGVVARRVINTWEGRGFLYQNPWLPRFWDHFCPGLGLLVPLWGLWQGPHLFFMVQALCLTFPALFLFALVRRLGGSGASAFAWCGAFLFHPAVGQLNLSFSHGWHPVSLSLLFFMAAVWALSRRRRSPKAGENIGLALFLAFLACSFRESVFLDLAGVCFGFAVLKLVVRRTAIQENVLSESLSVSAWLVLGVLLAVVFVALCLCMDFTRFQASLFSDYGGTPRDILWAPIQQPKLFWGRLLGLRSLTFVLLLLVPLGLEALARGVPVLLGVVVPLTLLLSWGGEASSLLGFQYVTMTMGVLFIAAVIGSAGMLQRAGLAALASSYLLSAFCGALPWSAETTPFFVPREDRSWFCKRQAALDEVVALAERETFSVLATGRIAAHLLRAEYLDDLHSALQRQQELSEMSGEGKTWIEAFDWVLLDTRDLGFMQEKEDLREAVEAVRKAKYPLVFAEEGVLAYVRPGLQAMKSADPLAPWRVSSDLMSDAPAAEGRLLCPDILQLAFDVQRFISEEGVGCQVKAILMAANDTPGNWVLRHEFLDEEGRLLGSAVPAPVVGGNYPTYLWMPGEAFRVQYFISIPEPLKGRSMKHRLSLATADEGKFFE